MITNYKKRGIVTEKQPPDFEMVNYWERSLHPFHADAMPDEFKLAVPQGKRASGWMAIDWIENPIGFVTDGDECNIEVDFEIVESYGPFSKLCAINKNSHTLMKT